MRPFKFIAAALSMTPVIETIAYKYGVGGHLVRVERSCNPWGTSA